MPSCSNVADKAVSTEDASEMVCFNAVLAALIENKLEALKATSAAKRSRWKFIPISFKRSRLPPSTVPTALNYCPHCHYHEKHKRHKKDHKHQRKRERRFDSNPCGKFGGDQGTRTHYSGRRRAEYEVPEVFESPERRRRSPFVPRFSSITPQDDTSVGLDSLLELMSLDGISEIGSLAEFVRDRNQELVDISEDYPGLHQSAYLSYSDPFLYVDYDNEDYIALDLEDELRELEALEELEDSLCYSDIVIRDSPQEQDHPPRRKRKRKQHYKTVDTSVVPKVKLVNHDDLSPRAKWTIIVTACILLAMSLILVGVTLRMAPIIDDMSDGRRASVSKKPQNRRPSTAGVQRKNSVRQTKLDNSQKLGKIATMSPMELEQARKHRRTVFIILGTFIFLAVASVLVIVVTLTNSSFHISPIGNGKLSEHPTAFNHLNTTFRKENEDLANSLKHDTTVPGNSTVPP